MVAFDLHCHSRHSDGVPTVHAIEEHCHKHGLGVALTDHNEIRGALELAERGRVPCLPATEIGTAEGFEFLAYFGDLAVLEAFYREVMEPHLLKRYMVHSRISTDEVLESARSFDLFLSLAHPFALGRKSIRAPRHSRAMVRRILGQVHALERHNGALPERWNRQAEELLERFPLKYTVGSDAHRLRELGSVRLEIETEADDGPAGHFEALREGRLGEWQARGSRPSAKGTASLAYRHLAFYLTSGRSSGRKANPPKRTTRSSRSQPSR
ncbi:MAG: PHP-associated domain-containing protein [Verrucomicrobiota bacterium]